jgi:hypothetical protein
MSGFRRRLLMAAISSGGGGSYVFNYSNLAFTGATYIDTGVALFSAANNTKPFELTTVISSITGGVQYACAVSSMLESNPYPGFVIRRNNDNTTPQAAAGGNFSFSIGDTVVIRRYDEGLMELLINGARTNLFVVTNQFNTPVTIGAGLNSSSQPWRYFVGTIGKASLSMDALPVSPTPTYQLDDHIFDGTAATAIETSYTLCDAGHTNWVLQAKMSDITFNEAYDTLFACFREQSPYAGVAFRRNNQTSQAELIGIGNAARYTASSYDVSVIRLGSNFYYRVNGAWGSGTISSAHDWPLVLGGRLNSSRQVDLCTAFKMEKFRLYLL